MATITRFEDIEAWQTCALHVNALNVARWRRAHGDDYTF